MDWDPDDRAIVLAYSLERALVCVSCGTAEWEWDAEQGGDPAAYTAMLMRCPGCASKDIANSTLPTDKQPGSSVRLVPTAVADKMSQTRRKRPKSRRERAGKT